jgi:hypothetical protein
MNQVIRSLHPSQHINSFFMLFVFTKSFFIFASTYRYKTAMITPILPTAFAHDYRLINSCIRKTQASKGMTVFTPPILHSLTILTYSIVTTAKELQYIYCATKGLFNKLCQEK